MMKTQVNHAHLEVSEVMGVPLKSSISGWWYTYPSEKYESQLGLWNSQYMESHNPAMFQTTNQTLIGCS